VPRALLYYKDEKGSKSGGEHGGTTGGVTDARRWVRTAVRLEEAPIRRLAPSPTDHDGPPPSADRNDDDDGDDDMVVVVMMMMMMMMMMAVGKATVTARGVLALDKDSILERKGRVLRVKGRRSEKACVMMMMNKKKKMMMMLMMLMTLVGLRQATVTARGVLALDKDSILERKGRVLRVKGRRSEKACLMTLVAKSGKVADEWQHYLSVSGGGGAGDGNDGDDYDDDGDDDDDDDDDDGDDGIGSLMTVVARTGEAANEWQDYLGVRTLGGGV
jgi:hypothetical protein